jgi:ABC-type dipeptide/oligopeptide/nickel transport system permease component
VLSELAYLGRRLVGALITILLAVTLNFALFRAAPGNAASLTHVPSASPELRRALTHQFGLDESIPTQYVRYLEQLLHGNLGVSFSTQLPVWATLRHAIANTLIFALPGLLLAVALALATGLLSAWRHGTVVDHISRSAALVLYALPAQWLAILIIFAGKGHFPSGGKQDLFRTDTGTWAVVEDVARHAVLPVITYMLIAYGSFMIVFRTSLLQSLSEDYILTAKSKGLTNWQVVRRHALPTALLPVTTLFGLALGSLVAGVLLIETAFSWPGVGLVVYNAVRTRDYPVLEGAFLVFTTMVVLANLAVDLIYRRLDPRVRVGRRA